jgi:hypothetical protein
MMAPLSPFYNALLFHEVIDALIAVMLTFIRTPVPETGETLKSCLVLLRRMLVSIPGYTWLEEALDAGPHRVIVTLECAWLVYPHSRYFLAQLIPLRLVFYHDVLQLETSLEEITDISGDAF